MVVGPINQSQPGQCDDVGDGLLSQNKETITAAKIHHGIRSRDAMFLYLY
jgi:hypothetical protein